MYTHTHTHLTDKTVLGLVQECGPRVYYIDFNWDVFCWSEHPKKKGEHPYAASTSALSSFFRSFGVVWPPSKVRSGSLSLSIRLLFAMECRMSWGFATSVFASNRPDGEISAEEFSLFGYLSPYFQAPELPIQRGLLSKFGKGPDSPLFHIEIGS